MKPIIIVRLNSVIAFNPILFMIARKNNVKKSNVLMENIKMGLIVKNAIQMMNRIIVHSVPALIQKIV